MTRCTRTFRVLLTTLAFTLVSLTALAQTSPSPSTTSLSAYVYVSTSPTSTTSEIKGYTAYSNGVLGTITGSPFATKGSYMALNGSWLFDTNGIDIYSFKIESTGTLHAGPATNAQQYNVYKTSGGPIDLFLDHTGQSLYDGDIYIDGANNGYQAFKIIQTTGQTEFQQDVKPYTAGIGEPLSFVANNLFAYSASCLKGTPDIYGYKRSSTGTLTDLNISPHIPASPISGSAYCPFLAAADPYNHVAISLTPFAPYYNAGPPQIAVYTASSTGSLTTTSTASNMPKSSVVSVTDLKMSPSGKLLAVAGSGGVQVFHFNGASPVTKYTGRLTTNEIDQMFWDNSNHLYAISKKAGKLYVWTVTPTYVAQASGSPHTVYHPLNIIVLPK